MVAPVSRTAASFLVWMTLADVGALRVIGNDAANERISAMHQGLTVRCFESKREAKNVLVDGFDSSRLAGPTLRVRCRRASLQENPTGLPAHLENSLEEFDRFEDGLQFAFQSIRAVGRRRKAELIQVWTPWDQHDSSL